MEKDLFEVSVLVAGRGTDADRLGEICSYLTNPYSGYPALGRGVLLLLDERKFSDELHLNTIAGKYREATGAEVASLLSVEDVDLEGLEQAILIHWKEINPSRPADSIEEIVDQE